MVFLRDLAALRELFILSGESRMTINTGIMAHVRLPFPVPYAMQIASPELAEAFWVHALDPATDPRWAESGAASPAEYAYWSDRACGPVCVKMCVEALGGPVRTMLDWVRAGLALDGYISTHDDAGKPVERGWAHRALAGLIQDAGFAAEAVGATPAEIVDHLAAGRLVIASVSAEIGTEAPITHTGGHLVVVVGADVLRQQPVTFIVHNPSGRTPARQASAVVSAERFAAAFTGRVIVAAYPLRVPNPAIPTPGTREQCKPGS
jgi:hypothetical protein